MTTRKTHDADLCERIRELEKRVEELERRPTSYWSYPWWGVVPPYWTSPYYPYATTISGSVSIGNVTSDVSAQSTFTGSVS